MMGLFFIILIVIYNKNTKSIIIKVKSVVLSTLLTKMWIILKSYMGYRFKQCKYINKFKADLVL